VVRVRARAHRQRFGSSRVRGRAALLSFALFVIFAGVSSDAARAAVVLSEILARNSDDLADEDGDHEDWIELQNLGSESVDLEGWALSDDPDLEDRWLFPAVTRPPGDYLIVFASGKDRRAPGDELHASFRLDGDGEFVALLRPDGSIADSFAPSFPRQLTDISWGRAEVPGVGVRYVYFEDPSPGAPSSGPTRTGVVADPRFSAPRGIRSEPFDLEITSPTPAAEIRYTVDRSIPSESNGEIYTDAIRIDRTTTVRAIVYAPDHFPSAVETHTYIFPGDVVSQPTMVRAITGHPTYGPLLEGSLRAIPSVSIVTATAIRTDAEIPASIELIRPDGREGFQVMAGIKRVGGHSLGAYPKNNMRVYFRERHGGPSKLEYPLFEDVRHGERSVTSFDRLNLRSGSHDSVFYLGDAQQPPADAQYLRNRFMSDLQFEMGRPSLNGRWAHLYVNGIYWGHYHILEHPSPGHMAEHSGGEKEEW